MYIDVCLKELWKDAEGSSNRGDLGCYQGWRGTFSAYLCESGECIIDSKFKLKENLVLEYSRPSPALSVQRECNHCGGRASYGPRLWS